MAENTHTEIIRIEIDQSIINKSKTAALALSKKIEELAVAQKLNRRETDAQKTAYIENEGKLKGLKQTYNQHIQVLKQAQIAADANTGSNVKLKAQLSALTSELNRLEEAGQSQTDEAKLLRHNVEGLTAELIANESAVLNNRRKVGDYEGALKSLKTELRDAKDAMVAAAAANGMGSKEFQEAAKKAGELKDQLDDVNAATKEMASGSKLGQFKDTLGGVGNSLKNLDFDEAAEKAQRLAAIAKSMTFSEMIGGLKSLGTAVLNLGKALIVNPFFAFIAAVTAVGLALKAWSDSNDEALASQKKLNDEYEKSRFEIKRLDIEYRKITGSITAFQASIETLNTNYQESLRDVSDETEKQLKETIGWWDKFLLVTTQGRFGSGKILTAVKDQLNQEKILTEKHVQETVNLYAQQTVDLIEKANGYREEAAAIRAETAAEIKKESDERVAAAKEEANKLREIEKERLADLKAQFDAAEQEKQDIRMAFLAERITAQQTEAEREQAELRKRLEELKFAGLKENELEEFITSENTRIRVEAKAKQLAEAEALINQDAELAKQRAIIEIEDANVRAATLYEIEKLRLEGLQMLYDQQAATALAATEGAIILDDQTKALMLEKETAYQAQLVELTRSSEEKKRSEADKTLQLQLSNTQQQFSAVAGIIGDIGQLAEEGSKEAKDIAIAQGIINAFASAISAYNAGSAVPVIGVALGPIAAAAALAAGLANVSKIKAVKAARGTHLKDGQGTETSDSIPAYLSKNETVINAKSSKAFLPLLSQINEWGGGVAFAKHGGSYDYLTNKFAGGGVAVSAMNNAQQLANSERTINAVREIVPVLVLEEFQSVQGRQVRTAQALEL